MSYIFKISEKGIKHQIENVVFFEIEDITLYYRGFSEEEASQLIKKYQQNELDNCLISFKKNSFFLIVWDKRKNLLFFYNDQFGSNQILYYTSKGSIIISDDISTLEEYGGEVTLDVRRLQEVFVFQCINPPYTVFSDVLTVPFASSLCVEIDSQVLTVERYWSPKDLFEPKVRTYETLVKNLRSAFEQSIKEELKDERTKGVALSGGVDSGGVLAMVNSLNGMAVSSITVGPYGIDSGDLASSRKTAQALKSPNTELYPSVSDLKKLPRYLKNINQPMDGHVAFVNGLIFDEAKKQGIKILFTGFGTDALLGTQKYNKLAYYLVPFEHLFPRFFTQFVYRCIGRHMNYSRTKLKILEARTWTERFLRIKGALFERQKNIFKIKGSPFTAIDHSDLDAVFFTKNMNRVDKMIYADWTKYHIARQTIAIGQLARGNGIFLFSPAYTPRVAAVFLKATNSIRKKDGWDKKVLRDALQPYIPVHLYSGKRKSLIFPYENWFDKTYTIFITYLSSSPPIKLLFDLGYIERNYFDIPARGFLLIRLLSIAVWYDTHWRKDALEDFNAAVVRAEEILKTTSMA